jgi:hypothetical protein
MAESQDHRILSPAERLKEVALLLKQADQLVKEDNLAAALELIAQARSHDSHHLYAIAYEEHVRTMLEVKQKKEKEPRQDSALSGDSSPSQHLPSPELQHFSNLAIIEAQHKAAIAEQQEHARVHLTGEGKELKQDEERHRALEAKISAVLTRAAEFLDQKEYDRAFDELARAKVLDPENESARALEKQIQHSFEESANSSDAKRREKEELLQNLRALKQKEIEEKFRRQEEERRQVRSEEVRRRLKQINELIHSKAFDDALNELSSLIIIDPLNEEVVALQQTILAEQDRRRQQQLEQFRAEREEQEKERTALLSIIKRNIQEAERLMQEHQFKEALTIVARTTVLDPLNEELQHCEERILAMQEEQRMLQQKHSAVAPAQSVHLAAVKEQVETHVKRARQFLAHGQIDSALEEMTQAFSIDPFNEEIRRLEEEVLAAQENQMHGQHAEPSVEPDALAQQIAAHLAKAEQFRKVQRHHEAFNEVARAFVLDPLDRSVQEYEQTLQKEFDAYHTDQQEKNESAAEDVRLQMHITLAAEFLKRSLFDHALAEIISGLAIDEKNDMLLDLERQVLSLREVERLQPSGSDVVTAQTDARSPETLQQLISSHLNTASAFRQQQDYINALAEVARGLLLDPNNAELLSLDNDIREEQSRHDPAAKHELKLIYSKKKAG